MRECFIHVGLAQKADETFTTFAYTKKGILTRTSAPAALSEKETLSVGEVSSELAVTTRPAEAEGEEASADDSDAVEADSDPPSSDEDGGDEDE